MEERNHGFENGVEDDLETRHSGNESEWTKHSKGSQRLHVERLDLQEGKQRRHEADHHDHEIQNVPSVS